MNIRDVIVAINRMLAEGVIDHYAIGGAVGATFYLEPVATMDVDIFVTFPAEKTSSLVSPKPLFDYLKDHGGTMQGEYIVVAGWPVQFLPPTSQLAEEALKQSVEKPLDGMPARVLTAEHLAAIALQTGRAKDKARLLQFIEAGVLDAERFEGILAKHALTTRWQQFQRQFLSDNS